MVKVEQYVRTLALLAAIAAAARFSAAQVIHPGARPIRTTAVAKAEVEDDDDFMTLTISSGQVNFGLVAGSSTNPGNSSVTVNLKWTCPCDTPSFELYAYFSNSTAALTDGIGDNIPSSAFFISDNGGPLRALSNTQPFGGGSAGLHLVSIPAFGNQAGSHTDVLNFNLNLSTGTLPKLPPGAYTGTLIIQGQAQ